MFSYSNWSVLTVNFLVVLYLALGGVTLSAVLHLAGARWRYEIRFLASSLFALFPLAFVLLVVLLVNADATFPWVKMAHEHKLAVSSWDGFTFLAWREIIGMLLAMTIHWVFIKRQAVSERSPEDAARFHSIACWVPYVYVLYGTMVAWDFEMFMVPGWQSGIFGMQEFISFFGMFLSFLVIWIYFLNSRNRLVNPVKPFVYNYLAQMMLAFTLLWIYTYYAQYLILWYGNIPEERDRINWMQDGGYTVIWWAVIALKMVIPFASLTMPFVRHNINATMAVATCIIIGTIFERYIWIAGANGGVGAYPYFAAIVVSAVVAIIGFFLVRMRLHSTQLVKG